MLTASTLAPADARSLPDEEGGDAPLSPSVSYLVTVIRDRIVSGRYAQGERLPSERALCTEFSLSRPTVRLAIEQLERQHLIRRLAGHRPVVWSNGRTAEEKNGSTASTIAAASPRIAGSIGLWISGTPGDFGPMAVTRSAYQAASGAEMRLVVACPNDTTQEETIRSEADALRRMARDTDIAGVILWYQGGAVNLPALNELREAGKILVFVDRRPPAGFDADYVGVYNEYAAADAVRHLIALGHRDIVHVTTADRASSVQERQEGYRQALEEAGIPYRPEFVLATPLLREGELGSVGGIRGFWRATVEQFLALPGPPTAVFAVNDYSARRFIDGLRDVDLRVPDDIALVGFDDSDRWKPDAVPKLTSASQPFERMGGEAVKLLMKRLGESAAAPAPYRHLLLPASLSVRESSGASRKI